jgi:hypothetical protein
MKEIQTYEMHFGADVRKVLQGVVAESTDVGNKIGRVIGGAMFAFDYAKLRTVIATVRGLLEGYVGMIPRSLLFSALGSLAISLAMGSKKVTRLVGFNPRLISGVAL